jgi:hypothetical protein
MSRLHNFCRADPHKEHRQQQNPVFPLNRGDVDRARASRLEEILETAEKYPFEYDLKKLLSIPAVIYNANANKIWFTRATTCARNHHCIRTRFSLAKYVNYHRPKIEWQWAIGGKTIWVTFFKR